jgi:hypothetical protein
MDTFDQLPAVGGLDGFELWDRTVRAPAHKEVKVAFVSVLAGGNVGMNKAAYKMWGEPEACQVMYDPERRRLALKPVSPEDPNSFNLYWDSRQVPCKSLFDYYGVEITQSRRYHDPKVIDGVLVVDL